MKNSTPFVFVLQGCGDEEKGELILDTALLNMLIYVLEDLQDMAWIWFLGDGIIEGGTLTRKIN